jgi:hypothetical protein
MSTSPDSHNSLESRLARAAQGLDTAADQYAHKRSPSAVAEVGSLHAVRIRRMTSIASIAGIAAAFLLVGSIVRDQRQKGDSRVVAMSGVGANPATFPFVGQLTIPINLANNPEAQGQQVNFVDGVALPSNGNQRFGSDVFTIRSAIDVDIDSDGKAELALLISRHPIDRVEASTIPGNPSLPSSMVAIYSRSGTALTSLAAMRSFADSVDGIGVNGNGLVIARQVGGKPTVAAISGSIIRDAVLEWAAPTRTLTVSELAPLDKSSREIRFRLRTTSGLVIADAGKRAGWFRAKAGQMLHIDVTSVPTGTTRTVTIRRRSAPAEDAPLATATLPGPMQFVLPADDEYEVLVGDGDSLATFELAIDQPGNVTAITAQYAPTVPASVPLAEIPTPSREPEASTIPSPDSLADSSVS